MADGLGLDDGLDHFTDVARTTRPKTGGKPMPTGTISLDQPNPALGDTVTFTWTAEGLHGQQSARIEINARQSVPFDYTDSNGETHTQTDSLVFSSAAPADEGQLLGGSASVWLWHGGPADCEAILYYWDNHPSQHQVILASVPFSAAG